MLGCVQRVHVCEVRAPERISAVGGPCHLRSGRSVQARADALDVGAAGQRGGFRGLGLQAIDEGRRLRAMQIVRVGQPGRYSARAQHKVEGFGANCSSQVERKVR